MNRAPIQCQCVRIGTWLGLVQILVLYLTYRKFDIVVMGLKKYPFRNTSCYTRYHSPHIVVSHYCDVWLFEMLLIMITDQYSNYYKAWKIYTGYFDSLDIITLFSYPSSIVIPRDYCIVVDTRIFWSLFTLAPSIIYYNMSVFSDIHVT